MKKEDCYKTRNLKIKLSLPFPYSVTYSYFGHTYLMLTNILQREINARGDADVSRTSLLFTKPQLYILQRCWKLTHGWPLLTHIPGVVGWSHLVLQSRRGRGESPPPKAPSTAKLRCFSWLQQFLQIRNFINFCRHTDTAIATSGNQTSTSLECLGGDGRHHPDVSLAKGYVVTRTPRHLPPYRSTSLLLFRIYLNIFNKTLYKTVDTAQLRIQDRWRLAGVNIGAEGQLPTPRQLLPRPPRPSPRPLFLPTPWQLSF